jgi:hypothetical protein
MKKFRIHRKTHQFSCYCSLFVMKGPIFIQVKTIDGAYTIRNGVKDDQKEGALCWKQPEEHVVKYG